MAFIKVAAVGDVPPGQGIEVTIHGKTLAVFNSNGTFYAIDNTCTHTGAPLAEGECEGIVVHCPWHGARFDLTSGKVLGGPARKPISAYTVQVVGDEIQVDV